VYRRDNVSKVEKDEALARQKEEEEREKHENAEREYRRGLLLQRSMSHAEASTTSNKSDHQEPLQPALPPTASSSKAGPSTQIQHINFWREDEGMLTAQHPDAVVREAAIN
jgi:hypothetical protein